MNNKIILLVLAILFLLLVGCNITKITPTTTSVPVATEEIITITPSPTEFVKTLVITEQTEMVTPVSNCDQVLYQALEESAKRAKIEFPGIFASDTAGDRTASYYTISLGQVKTELIDGWTVDMVKMLAVDADPATDKPVIRTYWQELGRNYEGQEGSFGALATFQYLECEKYTQYICATDNLINTLIKGGLTHEVNGYNYWNRDPLLTEYKKGYSFVFSYATTETGANAVYTLNPFGLNPTNALPMSEDGTSYMPQYDYESKNGWQFNNFATYKPYPEDWVNTIFNFYRTEPIENLKTVPVADVLYCLNQIN